MVTSDLHSYFNLSLHLSCLVYSTELLLRTIVGHFSFWTVFCFVEISKVIFQLDAAILNVSCFLQFSIIMNFDWVHSSKDKKVIAISLLTSLAQVLIVVLIDYILMYLGIVPMLSKGSFSLYFGGQELVGELPEVLGSPVTPVFIGCSFLLQLSLQIYKGIQTRKLSPPGYSQNLRLSVVQGLSNTYNFITILIMLLGGLVFIIIHFIAIFNNRTLKQHVNNDDLPPFSLIFLAFMVTFWNCTSFFRNTALRGFAIKFVKSSFKIPRFIPSNSVGSNFQISSQVNRERSRTPVDDMIVVDLE